MMYIHTEAYHSNENKRATTWKSMDGSHKHYIKQNKPDTQKNTYYMIAFI